MKDLRINGLTKSFGTQRVLRGVDLTVPHGSFTAILGASGSGKTTLLRVVAGFERPDDGEIALGDEIVDDARHRFVPSEHRRIGYVPQEGALFPHLNVGRNIAFGLARGPGRKDRVRELIELVGLSGLGRRYPHQLSGGQQQRVALARALAVKPEVVLLDEPFSSLDAALRASVRADVLQVLRDAGSTSILVTHDQDEALSAADHVAVLRNGQIIQADTPRQIYQCPADPQTATFVGTANLLAGTWDGARVTTALGRHGIHASQQAPAPGQVTVLIRPEQISLTPPVSDTIPGRVTATHYYGHDALVAVRPDASGDPDGSAGELRVRVSRSDPPEPGEFVSLTVCGSVAAWAPAGGD
jgi:iron(III) transport system ATP-binding protein